MPIETPLFPFDLLKDLVGSLIVVTGSGPYPEQHLVAWLEAAGMFTTAPTPGKIISYVVLGRYDYESDLLGRIWPAVTSDRCLSQEDFIGLVLLNLDPASLPLRDRAAGHQGLAAMQAEMTKRLPSENALIIQKTKDVVSALLDIYNRQENTKRSVLIAMGDGLLREIREGLALCRRLISSRHFFDPTHFDRLTLAEKIMRDTVASLREARDRLYRNWPAQSDLRAKYDYTVDSSTTPNERKAALERAVSGLGLYKVANHIAAFVSLESEKASMDEAVERWKEDLVWLKETHYHRQFTWPDHWAV